MLGMKERDLEMEKMWLDGMQSLCVSYHVDEHLYIFVRVHQSITLPSSFMALIPSFIASR